MFKKTFNLSFLGLVFLYCGVIPLAYWLSGRVRRFIDALNLPLPPPVLCVVTVVVLVTFEVIKRQAPYVMQDPVGELREANLEVLFLAMGLWFYMAARAARAARRSA